MDSEIKQAFERIERAVNKLTEKLEEIIENRGKMETRIELQQRDIVDLDQKYKELRDTTGSQQGQIDAHRAFVNKWGGIVTALAGVGSVIGLVAAIAAVVR